MKKLIFCLVIFSIVSCVSPTYLKQQRQIDYIVYVQTIQIQLIKGWITYEEYNDLLAGYKEVNNIK